METLGGEPFDPKRWFSETRLSDDQVGHFDLQGIHGPMDAYVCVKLRELTKECVSTGKAVPTDVFILSTGEPANRAATKIGGAPYWRRDRPWPMDGEQNPIPFLAQFNFSQSRDIVPNTPGDILLIFAHANPHEGCVLRWESLTDSSELVSNEVVPVHPEAPAFFGTRWRTDNYPDWQYRSDYRDSNIIQLPDGRYVYALYFAYELLGMQISESGFIPPGDISLNSGDKIICSISGIAVVTERLYPFLNQRNPVDEVLARKWLVPLSDIEDADGFGVIVIVQDKNEECRCVLKNL